MSQRSERSTDTARLARNGPLDPATEAFVAHRNLLFTVAYEMLGSAADAEDVLQETWLRWAGVDLGAVRDRRAFLVRITTREALIRLRTLRRRKESYVGPWLPEPLLTAPDVAEDVELADSVSTAMMLVLETLTPTERAVFVLREVFELGYGEIADAVDKTPAAVRQIAHRARAHVAARRPREAVPPAEARDALDAFRQAVETGDMRRLLDILAPDVVLLTDGGGVVRAALAPVVGAGRVTHVLAWLAATASLRPAQVNGHPALIIRLAGEADSVLTMRIDNGLITGLYAVRNPEKLSRLDRETAVSRSVRTPGPKDTLPYGTPDRTAHSSNG
ncbi:RNA polymerase sigma-70 factor [Yinghuangia sp. ASG 101]|uniref:RNA polymerase sigma-70 factor n=1 Tax=Yinghuangia sp. ASG 101 TaxID=2896848 RepID=UPI001E5C6283|nr:RNA polymerase sigma-70 factor [Yinghuangia sp. ASG 101]UGQ11515.1 RNA polymerase sigma-70 factor [Yinghuangia sp. ASG 101]